MESLDLSSRGLSLSLRIKTMAQSRRVIANNVGAFLVTEMQKKNRDLRLEIKSAKCDVRCYRLTSTFM